MDGIALLVETIMSSAAPLAVIAIGPMNNVAEALRQEPHIAARARFVSMLGSIDVGHFGMPGAMPEFNVVMSPDALRTVLAVHGWKR